MNNQMTQKPLTQNITWDGRIIHLSYCPKYLEEVAHVEIRTQDGEPMPITETGYKSHFVITDNPPCLEDVILFVTDWLDQETKSKSWLEYSENSKQLTLF